MEISNWLKQPNDYNAGVALYRKHGKNKALLSLFELGNTLFARKKLIAELTTIATALPEPVAAKPQNNNTALPPELESEQNKLGDIIREIAHLHAQLMVLQTDQQRGVAAARIVELGDLRRTIFNRIDNYVKTGSDTLKIKEKAPLTESRELKLFRLKNELQLLRAQRSKLKSKPHRLKDYNAVCDKIEMLQNQIQNEG